MTDHLRIKPEVIEQRVKDRVNELIDLTAVAHVLQNELPSFHMKLDQDPLKYGPLRLAKKVAQLSNMTDRVQELINLFTTSLLSIQRARGMAEVSLNLRKNDLILHHPEVSNLPTAKEREYGALQYLPDLSVEIHALTLAETELKDLIKALSGTRRNLSDIRTQLNSQQKLCLDYIRNLNGKWGSADPDTELVLQPDPARPARAQGRSPVRVQSASRRDSQLVVTDPSNSSAAEDHEDDPLVGEVSQRRVDKLNQTISDLDLDAVLDPSRRVSSPRTTVDDDFDVF